ncbi:hypothetical protein GYMLUDRAFT_35538 [Collybiopsis luxurians FD-317 M1]|nr:hypothetical protein GYMLUDRAFT_35538 [Collybiopsis luxurians FD-317 M1]
MGCIYVCGRGIRADPAQRSGITSGCSIGYNSNLPGVEVGLLTPLWNGKHDIL